MQVIGKVLVRQQGPTSCDTKAQGYLRLVLSFASCPLAESCLHSVCARKLPAANFHALESATKFDGKSQQDNRWGSLCSSHNPTLQPCQRTAPLVSYTGRPLCHCKMGSLSDETQCGLQGLQPSCALALLGSWGTASRSACCFSLWYY